MLYTIEEARSGAGQSPKKLREIAAWYREFAERAGNPAIWECRLRTAEDLEAEALRIEKRSGRLETRCRPMPARSPDNRAQKHLAPICAAMGSRKSRLP